MRGALALAGVLALAGPATAVPSSLSALVLPPSVVLTKYAAALVLIKEPLAFSFEYALDQSGVHNLSSQHRVYRSGTTERDETIAINGQRTRRPEVRIFRNRPNRYALAKIAPSEDAYIFTPAGSTASVGDSREKIAWSSYRFINAMPRETFAEPKPVPSVVVPLAPGGL